MASCENKYTTLLDLSRQAKVITGETACFDGKIQVGVPFSGYPTGVDRESAVSLGVVSSETAVFSGNTGTTIFDVSNSSSPNYSALFSGYSGTVWTNALFSGNTSGLTLPITPLSADTQVVGEDYVTTIPSPPFTALTTGPFWTLTQTATTSNGEHIIGIQYTGYTITYAFNQLSSIPSITAYTAYSGFTSASQENFSAGTLDYNGPFDYISTKEDATVDGILTTKKLIVTYGASSATTNYVLTQIDDTGRAEWRFNSASATTDTFVTDGILDTSDYSLTLNYNTGGSATPIDLSGLNFTGNTSGTCITDLYITNLYGCSPITVHDNIQSITSSATGATSFAFGKNTKAFGTYSHAEGYYTTASGLHSHAEGKDTVASGDYSHAEGQQTTASAYDSHAEGNNTTASGEGSHSEGGATTASGSYSHAEGGNAIASGNYGSHAEGYYTTASGDYGSHAEGQYTIASGNYGSHAEGQYTTASGDYGSHAGGKSSEASGVSSFIHSTNSLIVGDRSAILGGQNITGTTDDTVYVPHFNISNTISTNNGTLSFALSPQNNLSLPNTSFIRMSGTGNVEITGLAGGTDGKRIVITNAGADNITFNTNNTGSTAVNRIINGNSGTDKTLSTNDAIEYIYDSITQRWRYIGGSV